MKTKNSSAVKGSGVKSTFSVLGIISLVVLLTYVVTLLLPLCWALVTSFRENLDFVMNGGWAMPEPWTLYNYKLMFVGDSVAAINPTFVVPILVGKGTRNVQVAEMVMNSLLYAIGSSVLAMLMSLLVSYVVARFDFKFCTVIIIQMIIPIVGALPSQLEMVTSLKLYDSIFGMWVMNTYVQGLYFLVFYASFKQIPKDFTEAAQIDGAGNFNIMVRIIFPFVKGSIFTVILLNFIAFWNDFQTPLIFMPSHPTLAFGLYWYTTGALDASSSSTPAQLAGCIIVAIPLLVIFIAFQKRLLGNITIGGLK